MGDLTGHRGTGVRGKPRHPHARGQIAPDTHTAADVEESSALAGVSHGVGRRFVVDRRAERLVERSVFYLRREVDANESLVSPRAFEHALRVDSGRGKEPGRKNTDECEYTSHEPPSTILHLIIAFQAHYPPAGRLDIGRRHGHPSSSVESTTPPVDDPSPEW